MKLNIGVLRGGFGKEHNISLIEGGTILKLLPREKFLPIDLVISKEGELLLDGRVIKKEELKNLVDLIFNTLFGEFGQKGLIQEVLNYQEIPFVGQNSLTNRFSSNKSLLKDKIKKLNFITPVSYTINLPNQNLNFEEISDFAFKEAKEAFIRVSPPWIVKPLMSNFSINVYYAENLRELHQAVEKNLLETGGALIEQFIKGKEVVVSIIENFQGKSQYVSQPFEIKKPGKIFDLETKEKGNYEIVPLEEVDLNKKIEITEAAGKIFETLELKDLAVADFIIQGDKIYFLEINGNPGFSNFSVFPRILEKINGNLENLIEKLIEETYIRHQKEKNI